MVKMLDQSEMFVVVLTVMTFLIVIFFGLFSIAGGIQTLFNSYFGMSFYAPPPAGIINYMAGQLLVTMAGPPLSWGAALLNAINPNWWLNSYMSWHIAFSFGLFGVP
jgi:hypothetical protein